MVDQPITSWLILDNLEILSFWGFDGKPHKGKEYRVKYTSIIEIIYGF